MDDFRSRWLAQHPFLASVATHHAEIGAALEQSAKEPLFVPRPLDWSPSDGVPLLRAGNVVVGIAPELGLSIERLCEAVAHAKVAEKLRRSASTLREALREPAARTSIVSALAGGSEFGGEWGAGAARFLGWTAMRHALAHTVEAVSARVSEERWTLSACPTCGSFPAMAALVPEGLGANRRILSCGLCRTRFAYRRVGCPHCGNEDASRLRVLELSGEPLLRLDVCEACKSYVKTCTQSEGSSFLLEDWPTVHVDVIARDEGYLSRGTSLYDLEGAA